MNKILWIFLAFSLIASAKEVTVVKDKNGKVIQKEYKDGNRTVVKDNQGRTIEVRQETKNRTVVKDAQGRTIQTKKTTKQ